MKKYLPTIVLGAAALSVVIFLTYHLHQTSREKIISQFQENHLQVARQAAMQIQSYLHSRSGEILWLASRAAQKHPEREATKEELRDHFEHLKITHVNRVSLLDKKGAVTYSTNREAIGENHSRADFFSWARDPANGGSVWVGQEKAVGGSVPTGAKEPPLLLQRIFVVTPLFRESPGGGRQKTGGEFAGALLLAIDLQEMLAERSLLFVPMMKEHGVCIMDRDGTVLHQSDHPEMVTRNIREKKEDCNACHTSFDHVETMLAKPEGITEYQLKGKERMTAAFTSLLFANASWIVVVTAPLDEVTAFIRTHFRDTLLILASLAFLLGLVFYFAYRNYRRRVVGEMEVRRLQENQRLMETLQITQFAVDHASVSVAWLREDGRYLYVNDTYCALLGYSREEFLSLKISDLDPLIPAEAWPAHWENIKRQGGHVFEAARLSKQGVPIPLEIHANYLAYEAKELIVTFSRDIRPRKMNEEKLRRQYDRLAALRAIDMAITSSLDLRVTFNVFLEQVTANLNVDAAAILLLDVNARNRLTFAAGRGFRTKALQHTNLTVGAGYAGRVAQVRQPLCIPDLSKGPQELLNQSPELGSEGFVTYHGVPLVSKGDVKGVLEVFNRTPFEHDREWLDFLEAVATQAAIAIDNAILFNDLQKSNNELIQAYDSTLEGWSRALDLRDKETEGHSQRVTEMTLRLARKMGMTGGEMLHVRRGALLHDIGKMGIPDGILLKPGALSDDEWEIMRKHPVLAYELLFPIAHLRPALDIPYCHHEKWDGTGYPRGLKGEFIPLAARLFAVVDVWDALRSDRPYRAAWPEEKAIEYIRELAGKQFDPQVVTLFLEILKR